MTRPILSLAKKREKTPATKASNDRIAATATLTEFWIVWREGSNRCRLKHPNPESAWREARRIAALPEPKPRRMYVLQSVGYVDSQPT